MDKIKIGQIGTGHGHASGKMAVYRQSDAFDVVGIVESDAELRSRAEKMAVFEGLPWMTRDELLNAPGLNAVAIETRVDGLLDNAEACVDAGLHIHLDKPAGASLDQFKRIMDKAAKRHLAVQMGYMYRYNPGVVMLREFLNSGWLGEPFEWHAVMSKVVSPGSRRGLAEYTGGMMFELGCHLIDLMVAILGRPLRVTPYKQHVAPIDDGLADNTLAVAEYANGLASIKSAAQEVEGFSRRHVVLCGTEGTFHIEPLDEPNVRVALSKRRGKYVKGYQDIKIGDYPRYVADAADLAKIIRQEKDSDYSYQHDLDVQETVLKASGMLQ